jgi:hypothetical protein
MDGSGLLPSLAAMPGYCLADAVVAALVFRQTCLIGIGVIFKQMP